MSAICKDDRPCFARVQDRKCGILIKSYHKGQCPFCKEHREVTNKKWYPYNPDYGGDKQ